MIRCIAIDDEPIALSIIREYCRQYGDIELETFTSPVAGMERISEVRPDVVFLDIEMNSHNGITLARQLPPETCLVFTTAYSRYAIDGFEMDAVDFLQKPIFYPRFERAVNKALGWLERRETHQRRDLITLRVEYKNLVIDVADILFIEAMDNYVKLYLRDKWPIMSQITMKEMDAMLPSDRFVRVHRSFIVSLADIDKFSNRRIYMKGSGREIPVGRKYLEAFNNIYK